MFVWVQIPPMVLIYLIIHLNPLIMSELIFETLSDVKVVTRSPKIDVSTLVNFILEHRLTYSKTKQSIFIPFSAEKSKNVRTFIALIRTKLKKELSELVFGTLRFNSHKNNDVEGCLISFI